MLGKSDLVVIAAPKSTTTDTKEQAFLPGIWLQDKDGKQTKIKSIGVHLNRICNATEAHHAKEVLDVVLPADHQPPKMMEPGEKSFDSPASAVAPQRTTILRWRPALSTMRGDIISMP
jgi:hypothetical protein